LRASKSYVIQTLFFALPFLPLSGCALIAPVDLNVENRVFTSSGISCDAGLEARVLDAEGVVLIKSPRVAVERSWRSTSVRRVGRGTRVTVEATCYRSDAESGFFRGVKQLSGGIDNPSLWISVHPAYPERIWEAFCFSELVILERREPAPCVS